MDADGVSTAGEFRDLRSGPGKHGSTLAGNHQGTRPTMRHNAYDGSGPPLGTTTHNHA